MHTYERSLVEKYQGKPFIVVGVNGDPDRDLLRMAQEKEKLTWHSVWDGRGGPIARRFAIQGFPTVFLLDQRGVIRFKSVGAPSPEVLEQRINMLLQEMADHPLSVKKEPPFLTDN
jgi:hypothetical protein